MTTLSCKQCGHTNEGQRIYCHNCGAKLDRSSLPMESKPKESLDKQQRRLRKMTNPYNGVFVGWRPKLFKTLLCALTLAALIQAVRPPDGVPPAKKRGELVDAPQIILNLEEAIFTHTTQKITIPEPGINAYLGNNVKAKKIDLPFFGDVVKFDRVFVNTEEGSCRMVQQQSIYDYPFYLAGIYRIGIKDGKIDAAVLGGYIGRLPIHPRLMEKCEITFDGLWAALKREKQVLDKMQTIEAHKGSIVVVTKADSKLTR